MAALHSFETSDVNQATTGGQNPKDLNPQNLSDSYLLTYHMEQSPFCEANSFSASQEIPRILWNPKFLLMHSHVSATCPFVSLIPNGHILPFMFPQ